MESWTTKTNAENGSECEPHEDTREDIVEQSTVFRFEQENQTDGEITLFVSGLAPKVTKTTLYNLYSKYGTVIRHNIVSSGYGFVCFKHAEEAARALHRTNRIVLYGKTIYVIQQRMASVQKLREQKFLLSVEIMPGMFPYEKFRSIQVNKDRFGMDNVISNALSKSLGCLVIRTKAPRERVDITQNKARMSVSVSGATMMWIRLNSQGHNENNGAFTQIVLKVTRSLDSGRFQLILNRATMEELKMIPPSQNKSPQEKKQDARRLRKLKQDMTRHQEVLRIKRLHKHDKCIREQQVMSTNTFLAASVEQINQGRTCPMLMDSDSSSNS